MERAGVKVGDAVTIAVIDARGTPQLRTGEVSYIPDGPKGRRLFSVRYRGGIVADRISFHREGTTWCRGHSGPEVDALAVALALR